MTVCSLLVVIFFLSKIAPLIIKKALNEKPIFDDAKIGYIKILINYSYKFFYVMFRCLADVEVLYYLCYGCMSIIGLVIHPFFFAFHLSVILIRYPTLKNVIRAISEPRE